MEPVGLLIGAGRAGPAALNLYLDASALVKRYVAEPGSQLVRQTMQRADAWFICRIGFVETVRAVGLTAGEATARVVREEWASFGVVEVDQELVENAASLALAHDLRSLDALHLAAALLLPRTELEMATWDRRLHVAARSEGLAVLPDALD
ncbi:MAG: type II toxin-antitoxin system VapC family toxin [Acidimicrobiales bacterium]